MGLEVGTNMLSLDFGSFNKDRENIKLG